jgi:Carboxypeptidase regulatory-like domain/TonB-dependent Receptor Plug Domain
MQGVAKGTVSRIRMTTGRIVMLVGLLALLPWMLAERADAQAQNTGTVTGNITDPQGAVVVKATVTLTSTETDRVVESKSNARGQYVLSDVPVGTYTLKIAAPTFKAYVVDKVNVDADQNVRIDAKLLTGSATDAVTVEAEGTTIDSRSATLGTMIDKNLVENLPIDGENIVSLAALLPGVTNVNAPTTFTSDTGGPTYSVSGSRGNQNLFLLDGSIWNNAFYNTGLNYPPRLAMQEVSVLLNNYKAQYGRNSGSVFNALTRSGSNTIHGTLWEYYQSSAFDAKDYISGLLPHLVENQFGATIGGPLLRDKLFYFLTYQDLRLAGQVVATDETQTYAEMGLVSPGVSRPCSSQSPFVGQTCADYTNDFQYQGVSPNCLTAPYPSTCVTPATAVRNPVNTGGVTAISQINAGWQQAGHAGTSPCVTQLTAYMNSQSSSNGKKYLPTPEMPTNCFNPVSVAFINKYIPFATTVNTGTSIPTAYSEAKQPRNDQQGLARIDFVHGKHSVDSRFYVTNVNDLTSNSVASSSDQGVADYELDLNTAGIYFGSIGDTLVVTPNMVNVARAGYKRYTYNIMPTDPTTLQTLGSSLVVPGHPSLPKMEASGRFTVGSPNSGFSYTMTSDIELDDNFSWIRGNHNFQFGAQWLDIQYVHRFDQVPSLLAEQQNTGVSVGDFLLGLTNSETVGNYTNLAANQQDLYLYAQDDWRATSRLTINYGLRYEIPFSWKEKDGQGLTFIPGYRSDVFPTAPSSVAYQGDPGIGNPAPPTRYDNFGPRLGLVYDLFGNGRTSIRAGYGIFYDAINANVVGVGQPYHYTATYAFPLGGFSQPLLGYPAIPANYVKGNPQFVLPFTVNFADRNMVTPYVMSMNVGFQQRVARGATLEMNYVGKFGRHEMIPFDLNPAIYDCSGGYYQSNPSVYCPTNADATGAASYQARVLYPGFNYGGQGVVNNASVANSNYNGLQVVYTQRALRNINVFASYTYSKSLDLQSDGATNTAHVPQPNNLSTQYAVSDFNATQIFNMGWTWKLPELKTGYSFVRAVVNDWTFGGIYNARTGNPVNVTLAGDVSFTNERPQRPELVPGANPNLPSGRHRVDKVNEWFNTAAFENPTPGTFGNVSRNSIVGPAYINTNFVLIKVVQLPEASNKLDLRVDAFNVFNTPNLANPQSQLASATSAQVNFGQILATVGTNGVVGSNGRRIQLGAILHF